MRKLVVLALAALALTGCDSHEVAARVEDSTITTERVDALTEVDCALAAKAGQAGSGQPLRLRRDATLARLIDFEVLRRVAREQHPGYDQKAYAAQLTQMRTELAGLPETRRETAEEFFSAYLKTVLQLGGAATDQLKAQGVTAPQQEQVQQTMQSIYAQAREHLDIEVNPAYSPDANGVPGGADGSLSTAVSDYAKQASAAQPGEAYVSALPKSQLCG